MSVPLTKARGVVFPSYHCSCDFERGSPVVEVSARQSGSECGIVRCGGEGIARRVRRGRRSGCGRWGLGASRPATTAERGSRVCPRRPSGALGIRAEALLVKQPTCRDHTGACLVRRGGGGRGPVVASPRSNCCSKFVALSTGGWVEPYRRRTRGRLVVAGQRASTRGDDDVRRWSRGAGGWFSGGSRDGQGGASFSMPCLMLLALRTMAELPRNPPEPQRRQQRWGGKSSESTSRE